MLDRLEAAGYAHRERDPAHRRRTLVRISARAGELSAEIFGPVIRGTLEQAAAYPDAVLAGIVKFLAAHRALLDQYLDAAPAADDLSLDRGPATGSGTHRTTRPSHLTSRTH